MAKKKEKGKEKGIHLSYCAGSNWAGDGTKSTSPCPFKDSYTISTNRYRCYHCSTGTLPTDILAPAGKKA